VSHEVRPARLWPPSAETRRPRGEPFRPAAPHAPPRVERRAPWRFVHGLLDQRRFRGVVLATLAAGLLTIWISQLMFAETTRTDEQTSTPSSRSSQSDQVVDRVMTTFHGDEVPDGARDRWQARAEDLGIVAAVTGFMNDTPATHRYFASGSAAWFVRLAYGVVLGREPDFDAHPFVSRAATWDGRMDVIAALAASQEFLDRRSR
jgi:hypothetical protein